MIHDLGGGGLWVPPSPNMPTLDAALVYPSDSLRKALEAGEDPLELLPAATLKWARPGVLLYEGTAR